jgi:hypothetical protein
MTSQPAIGSRGFAMSSFGSVKQAYFRIGIHGAPPGTLLYRVHQTVEAGYAAALKRGLVEQGRGGRFTPEDVATTRYKIVQDCSSTEYALKVYNALTPMDVVNGKMIRKGGDRDGGYVMLDAFGNIRVAYSFGIGSDVSWDLDVAACDLQIYQYDYTIPVLPTSHPNFHFYQKGVAGAASADGRFSTLHGLLKENNHLGRHDLVLKMDVEGAEWDVLTALKAGELEHFSQIVIELHHLVNADIEGHPKRVIESLETINETHQVVHLHANNWACTGLIGGVFLPDSLEVTYVRRSDHQFEECNKSFPTDLDRPCSPNLPDIFLGKLGRR